MSKEDEEKILKETFFRIQKRLNMHLLHIKSFLKNLEESSSINAFLHNKMALMKAIVNAIPLDPSSCPFCQMHYFFADECEECPYGKIHGRCAEGREATINKKRLPDYAKIINARDRLSKMLESYYGGEDYERL